MPPPSDTLKGDCLNNGKTRPGEPCDALYILYARTARGGTLLPPPSDTLKGKLLEQWKNAVR